MMRQVAFRLKNIGRTFVTVHLVSSAVDIRVGETVGPFHCRELSVDITRLQAMGAIAIIDEAPAAKPSPRTAKSKTESEDTGNGK